MVGARGARPRRPPRRFARCDRGRCESPPRPTSVARPPRCSVARSTTASLVYPVRRYGAAAAGGGAAAGVRGP